MTRDLATYNAATNITTIASHRIFNAFGKLTSESNAAIDILIQFTGRPHSEATGLQNNWHRWYDVVLGQWPSEDPIGFMAGDPNLRRVVQNRVTYRVDPTGLEDPALAAWNYFWYDTLVQGPKDVLSGAGEFFTETGYYIRDVALVAVEADQEFQNVALTAITGKRYYGNRSCRVDEWSSAGKTLKPDDPKFWSKTGGRAVSGGAAGGTLGIAPLGVNTWEYSQDGDAGKYRRGAGNVAAGNLTAAAVVKVTGSNVRIPASPFEPLLPVAKVVPPGTIPAPTEGPVQGPLPKGGPPEASIPQEPRPGRGSRSPSQPGEGGAKPNAPRPPVQEPGKYSGNPAKYQLVETGTPGSGFGNWLRRYMRITEYDLARYNTAWRQYYRVLEVASENLGLCGPESTLFRFERMSAFRKAWLEYYRRTRDE
ncbi:MAG: RHS repeat-associated core domain-containing protein [Actinomycetota bacterium]